MNEVLQKKLVPANDSRLIAYRRVWNSQTQGAEKKIAEVHPYERKAASIGD